MGERDKYEVTHAKCRENFSAAAENARAISVRQQPSGVPRDMNNYFTGSSMEKCSRNTALKQSPIYTTSRDFHGSYSSEKYCLEFFCLLG